MALTSTIGTSILLPFEGKEGDATPVRLELLQTSGTGKATQGTIAIIGSATASQGYRLFALNYCSYSPSGNSEVVARFQNDIICRDATNTTALNRYDNHTLNYGPFGLQGGLATTYTVSIYVGVATATVDFVCLIGRKI